MQISVYLARNQSTVHENKESYMEVSIITGDVWLYLTEAIYLLYETVKRRKYFILAVLLILQKY